MLRRGGFCVQEVLTTVAHAASLHALARLSGDDAHRAAAERVESALYERCWDDRRGLFFDLAYPSGEPQRVSTWASLAPLALPNLPREMAERLAGHLADAGEYALPWPVPSTAASEPAFTRRTGPIPRYWRGETWLAGTWLLHRGLRHARLRRPGADAWRGRPRAWSQAAVCASTTTPSTARRRAPSTSGCRRSCSISTREHERPRTEPARP